MSREPYASRSLAWPFGAPMADGDVAVRTMPVLFENGILEGKTREWESEP